MEEGASNLWAYSARRELFVAGDSTPRPGLHVLEVTGEHLKVHTTLSPRDKVGDVSPGTLEEAASQRVSILPSHPEHQGSRSLGQVQRDASITGNSRIARNCCNKRGARDACLGA